MTVKEKLLEELGCAIVADYKCENPEDRYELAFCKKVCITEEEYELLKEILNGN